MDAKKWPGKTHFKRFLQLSCEELLGSSLIQLKKNGPKTALLVGPWPKSCLKSFSWFKSHINKVNKSKTVYVLKNWLIPLLQAALIPLMVSPGNQSRSCSWRKDFTVLLQVKTISLILNQAPKKDVQAEVRQLLNKPVSQNDFGNDVQKLPQQSAHRKHKALNNKLSSYLHNNIIQRHHLLSFISCVCPAGAGLVFKLINDVVSPSWKEFISLPLNKGRAARTGSRGDCDSAQSRRAWRISPLLEPQIPGAPSLNSSATVLLILNPRRIDVVMSYNLLIF